MPDFLEWMERATTGPILAEDDFHMKVLIPNVRKVTREFDIRYDGENPAPADDEFADCCVAMDADTPDENVRAIFKVAQEYRERWGEEKP